MSNQVCRGDSWRLSWGVTWYRNREMMSPSLYILWSLQSTVIYVWWQHSPQAMFWQVEGSHCMPSRKNILQVRDWAIDLFTILLNAWLIYKTLFYLNRLMCWMQNGRKVSRENISFSESENEVLEQCLSLYHDKHWVLSINKQKVINDDTVERLFLNWSLPIYNKQFVIFKVSVWYQK